jgi:predicted Rossmann fold nucleotide-binding protein DprA/Smf involved in DNA uptake
MIAAEKKLSSVFDAVSLDARDPRLPPAWKQEFPGCESDNLSAIGNLDLLTGKKLGLFCSRKCPGELILKSYDLMQTIRDAGITVISGFHAPMDKECLRILLRGKQPIILCPARSIEGMRIRDEYRKPIEQGRMLILSPFPAKDRRISAERAELRNQFVAALADAILFIHAAPGSKTEQLCREVTAQGKRIFTIDSENNRNLVAIGVQAVKPDTSDWFSATS